MNINELGNSLDLDESALSKNFFEDGDLGKMQQPFREVEERGQR